MNANQQIAIDNHCRFGFETAHPRFAHALRLVPGCVVLTVNSGYE